MRYPDLRPHETRPLIIELPAGNQILHRPRVVPAGSTNLAFIGQYAELPDEVVFTVEYSIRSAQLAVYTLLGVKKPTIPMDKGMHDPRVVFAALETAQR